MKKRKQLRIISPRNGGNCLKRMVNERQSLAEIIGRVSARYISDSTTISGQKPSPHLVEPHDVNVPAFKVVHHRRALSMDKFIQLASIPRAE
jgi:hypothetical protein